MQYIGANRQTYKTLLKILTFLICHLTFQTMGLMRQDLLEQSDQVWLATFYLFPSQPIILYSNYVLIGPGIEIWKKFSHIFYLGMYE